jgi:hypothetical protein
MKASRSAQIAPKTTISVISSATPLRDIMNSEILGIPFRNHFVSKSFLHSVRDALQNHCAHDKADKSETHPQKVMN